MGRRISSVLCYAIIHASISVAIIKTTRVFEFNTVLVKPLVASAAMGFAPS
jgi:hypothetical protein